MSNTRYTGIAENAKGGAVLVVEEGAVYYIEGMQEWPEKYLGKKVMVKGTLYEKKIIGDPINEKGEIVQGAWGTQWILKVEGKITVVQ